MVDGSASLGVLSSSGNMDDNLMNNQSIVLSYDNIDETYEYDRIEPSHEKLYTDGEESVRIDEDESSASGSDVEKPKILNIVKNVKGKKFEYDDNGKIHMECFLLFVDVNEFRNVLRDYIIQENFDIIRIKNEKARVTAICASDSCPWRIHASPSQDGRTFMIKSYEPLHTCIRQSEKNNVTSTWIAEKLKGSLNADPNMSYELMSNELSTKFGVEAHPKQLYRARRKGKEQVEEDYCDSYYSKEKYTTTYSGLVSPLPDLNTLEEVEVLPPPLRRFPGRPKKSRRREKDEVAPSDVRRRLSTVKCTNCEMLGQNKRSCQRAPVKAKKRKQNSREDAKKNPSNPTTQESVSDVARDVNGS
ncbi:putative transcription factor interactor and regulator CCHC(Zn) family [Senna tora]|uniref:Putative transcription factor interactor and regulator CCHC(Zn) family n=1 Tax=Senna tora TaxID=362788 RepID=A0A834WKK3_9FABA|nr:putative transcription factor interactor and regulator CCHC(Zn) family [Senna tora]